MNRLDAGASADGPRLVTFGGGKGGAGRSTLCAEIARSLGRQGHRVLCFDASPHCPTLHIFLHAQEPTQTAGAPRLGEQDAHIADYIQETRHREVWLASLATARRYPFTRPRELADAIVWQLRELDFDWVFIDLGSGLDPLFLDLFLHADIPLLVCTPEPAAVRTSTQFLRAALFHALSRNPGLEDHHDALERLLRAQPIHLNRMTLGDIVRREPSLRAVLEDTLDRLEVYLTINSAREGAERDLGHVLSHAWHETLGVYPRYLTAVDYEDRRWFYNRRTGGLHTSRGDEALSVDIEKIARNLMEVEDVDQRAPRPIPRDGRGHPALRIGLSPRTNPAQLRQHCRRLWEGYRREMTIAQVFQDADERTRMAERLEHLYRRNLTTTATASPPPRTPTDPPASGATGLASSSSAFNTHPGISASISEASEASVSGELRTTGEGAAFHIRPDQSPGRIITRLRQRHDLSLYELSQRTHIGLKYLTALEDADLGILPRPVYIRGYLREIARTFSVDSDQLIDEYFRLLDQR